MTKSPSAAARKRRSIVSQDFRLSESEIAQKSAPSGAPTSAAAEVGAPLGADFCAISLSDNLKSWETIERRGRAGAGADFVIALYNPASRARPYQLGRAFDLLRATKSPQTIVLFVRSAATPETRVVTTVLAEADPALADMRTLVIIGSAAPRLISRKEHRPWVYTPRAEQDGVR